MSKASLSKTKQLKYRLTTYLPQTGDYIITFTLANGDEYYGEFTVTDFY